MPAMCCRRNAKQLSGALVVFFALGLLLWALQDSSPHHLGPSTAPPGDEYGNQLTEGKVSAREQSRVKGEGKAVNVPPPTPSPNREESSEWGFFSRPPTAMPQEALSCQRKDLPILPVALLELDVQLEEGQAAGGSSGGGAPLRLACTGMPVDVVCTAVSKDKAWEVPLVQMAARGLFFSKVGTSSTPPVFIDIGANVGSVSAPLAHRGAVVHAFEVLPRNIQLLTTTRCVNRISEDALRIYHTALGKHNNSHSAGGGNGDDVEQECVVFSGSGEDGNAVVRCSEKGKGRDTKAKEPGVAIPKGYVQHGPAIMMKSFDESFYDGTGIAAAQKAGVSMVVKLDVEGLELDVLRGMSRLLKHAGNPPRIVMAEVWRSTGSTGIGKFMQEIGFAAFSVTTSTWLRSSRDFVLHDSVMVQQRLVMDTLVFVRSDFEEVFRSGRYSSGVG